ncbi:MAG: hypothetical protein EPO40_12000 [Myxococcaceae bacterium]|nr:MAG: hypothetical protein EPO40_12000 [Myxococcaceae bacterium]
MLRRSRRPSPRRCGRGRRSARAGTLRRCRRPSRRARRSARSGPRSSRGRPRSRWPRCRRSRRSRGCR